LKVSYRKSAIYYWRREVMSIKLTWNDQNVVYEEQEHEKMKIMDPQNKFSVKNEQKKLLLDFGWLENKISVILWFSMMSIILRYG
jgi:hypothetical protein